MEIFDIVIQLDHPELWMSWILLSTPYFSNSE